MKHAKQSAFVPFFMLLTVEMEVEIVYTSSRGATLEVRLLVVEDICFICTKMICIKNAMLQLKITQPFSVFTFISDSGVSAVYLMSLGFFMEFFIAER